MDGYLLVLAVIALPTTVGKWSAAPSPSSCRCGRLRTPRAGLPTCARLSALRNRTHLDTAGDHYLPAGKVGTAGRHEGTTAPMRRRSAPTAAMPAATHRTCIQSQQRRHRRTGHVCFPRGSR